MNLPHRGQDFTVRVRPIADPERVPNARGVS